MVDSSREKIAAEILIDILARINRGEEVFIEQNGVRIARVLPIENSILARPSEQSQRDTRTHSHEVVSQRLLNHGHTLVTIATEQTVPIDNGKNTGYHAYGTHWWTNPNCPESYKYLSLDAMYQPPYFSEEMGHPGRDVSNALYVYMQKVFEELFSRPFSSIVEFGTGGGEITRHFLDAGLDFHAVEGTTAGVEKLLAQGVPHSRITHANLKFLSGIGRRFDLAMCTEVAEHIEPWFASKIVQNCTEHADVIWFSAARGDATPHYHHSNEAPISAWDNLFAHFGFCSYIVLSGIAGRADRIYFNPNSSIFNELKSLAE